MSQALLNKYNADILNIALDLSQELAAAKSTLDGLIARMDPEQNSAPELAVDIDQTEDGFAGLLVQVEQLPSYAGRIVGIQQAAQALKAMLGSTD